MFTYIIEEDSGIVDTQYGVTIYSDGEMLDSYTMWFYSEDSAYKYAQKVLTILRGIA